MNSQFIPKLLGSAVLFSSTALISAPVLAQEAAVELDEVVISGEKLDRSLEETASSVVVESAEDLAEKPAQKSVQDALQDVPNVNYYGTVGVAPTIRGQDTQGPNTGAIAFFSGTVPRASINMDGRILNYFEYVYGTSSIWDVDKIEVYRGPQTSSQGANSIAGATIITTKDPSFTPEAAVQAEYGSYNTHRVAGMLSGPLGDQFAARVTMDYFGRDTFIDYVNSAFVKGDTEQDLMAFNGRAKLLWLPAEIPGLEAKLTYTHTQSNTPTQESALEPYDKLDNTMTNMPSWYHRTQAGIGDLSYEFDNGISLTSQTIFSDSYVKRSLEPAIGGTAKIDQQTWSEEGRVNFGDEESPLSGVAGVYFARTTSDEYLYYYGDSDFDDTKTNLGLFTEMDYRFADKWTLTGGLRYQRDQIERIGTSSFATSNLDYNKTFDAILPKLALAYEVTPGLTVGGMVNRGYNPGGVALDLYSGDWMTFDAETLWNYEIFGRAKLLDDRLTITGNLFYMDFSDAQRYVTTSLLNNTTQILTVNAEDAHAFGAEFGMSYEVLSNLRLSANAGILKTEITKFDSLPDYEGNEFSKSPGFMFGLGAAWDILPELTWSANVRHTDGYYSDDSNTAAYQVDAFTVANTRLTWQAHDNLQLYGYVNNIFDERVPTYLQANRSLGETEGFMLAPRMFGVGLKATF